MPTTPLDAADLGDAHASTRSADSEVTAGPPSGRYVPGSLLSGKYQLDELLGEGGMGAVWRATNLMLELPVAIKLIRADLDRGALRARLQLEARAAAKLGHPAIVRVFDVGESEFGDPFIVMEMLQGETMASMLGRGRLSGAHAVQLLLPIIDALGTAHSRGIVHRDLKPDNLMIALEDLHVQPKILDFGIAKLTDARDSDHKLTAAGTIVGSPDYMSPEQARGSADVDASTDIWSICVVLYEAITGCAPFGAANYNALLRAIVEDHPQSILDFAAGDEALWQIIQRGLSKARRDRYATMTELGQALAAWLVGHGVQEDAAGASVASKWLGKASDPSGLAPRSGSAPAIQAAFNSRATMDSHPGHTGIGRGPFTATIQPHADRKRAAGAFVLAAGLVACAALAIGWHAKRVPNESATRSSNSASALRPATPAVAEPATSQRPVAPTQNAVTPTVSSTVASVGLASAAAAATQVVPSQVARAAKPAARRVGSRPSATKFTPGGDAASPAPAAQPAPKTNERPLDLLAPY